VLELLALKLWELEPELEVELELELPLLLDLAERENDGFCVFGPGRDHHHPFAGVSGYSDCSGCS
jgi:hypothetical protein